MFVVVAVVVLVVIVVVVLLLLLFVLLCCCRGLVVVCVVAIVWVVDVFVVVVAVLFLLVNISIIIVIITTITTIIMLLLIIIPVGRWLGEGLSPPPPPSLFSCSSSYLWAGDLARDCHHHHHHHHYSPAHHHTCGQVSGRGVSDMASASTRTWTATCMTASGVMDVDTVLAPTPTPLRAATTTVSGNTVARWDMENSFIPTTSTTDDLKTTRSAPVFKAILRNLFWSVFSPLPLLLFRSLLFPPIHFLSCMPSPPCLFATKQSLKYS